MTPVEAMQKAITAVGGEAEMGRRLKITTQAVCKWPRVPADRAIDVVKACDGAVSLYELRPDVFPKDAKPDEAA